MDRKTGGNATMVLSGLVATAGLGAPSLGWIDGTTGAILLAGAVALFLFGMWLLASSAARPAVDTGGDGDGPRMAAGGDMRVSGGVQQIASQVYFSYTGAGPVQTDNAPDDSGPITSDPELPHAQVSGEFELKKQGPWKSPPVVPPDVRLPNVRHHDSITVTLKQDIPKWAKLCLVADAPIVLGVGTFASSGEVTVLERATVQSRQCLFSVREELAIGGTRPVPKSEGVRALVVRSAILKLTVQSQYPINVRRLSVIYPEKFTERVRDPQSRRHSSGLSQTRYPKPCLSVRSDLIYNEQKDAVGLIVKNEGAAGRFRARISILHAAWSHAGDDLPAYWSDGIEDDGRVLIGEGEEARIWISRFQRKGSLGLDRHIFYMASGGVQEATAYEREKYRWVRISREAEEKTTERSRVAVKVNLTSDPPCSCGAITATIEMFGNAATMQLEPSQQLRESKS